MKEEIKNCEKKAINLNELEKVAQMNLDAVSVKTETGGSISLFILPTEKDGKVEDMVYIATETEEGCVLDALSIESAATLSLLLSSELIKLANIKL